MVVVARGNALTKFENQHKNFKYQASSANKVSIRNDNGKMHSGN